MDANAVNALLKVTSQDIAYFRRGELSPAVSQKQSDVERGCFRLLTYILVGCIVLDLVILYFAKGDSTAIIAAGVVPTILGVGALVLLTWGRLPKHDPETAKVRQASGLAKMNIGVEDGHKRYIMVVEKADFPLSRELYDVIPEDEPIRVYYQKVNARFNKLLAVESNA